MIHELRTWPAFFELIVKGTKSYELRRYDRPFRARDELHLREWDPDKNAYTGRYARVTVTHMLIGPILGLREGWALMSVVTTEKGTE
jgi:hypothetical protein